MIKPLSLLLALCLLLALSGCDSAQNDTSSPPPPIDLPKDDAPSENPSSAVTESPARSNAPSAPAPAPPPTAPPTDPPSVDTPPYDPDPGSGENTDYDPMEMVDVRITVTDRGGNPVPNLCVNLEYAHGRVGSYQPGDALTGSSGAVLKSAHPEAAYTVIVTDRKQLDYAGHTQRGQTRAQIEVSADGDNAFTVLWELPSPRELDLAETDKVTLLFLDRNGKPVPDLWVSMTAVDDTSPEPRQIIPGITDRDGKVYWRGPETGRFRVAALLFEDEREERSKAQAYTLDSAGPGEEHSFTWNPQ